MREDLVAATQSEPGLGGPSGVGYAVVPAAEGAGELRNELHA